MGKHTDLGKLLCTELGRTWQLEKEDIGEDARLSKNGMVFDTETYAIPGIGHLCILRMRALLGLMRMETAVVAVTGKDLPLMNLDWVKAAGRETQIVELYDTQLEPYPTDLLDAFRAIRDRDADLPDMPAKDSWYTPILYPCSYHKVGRGLSERLAAAAETYVKTYASQLRTAPACDAPAQEAKAAKVRGYAESLLANGGPAVDQITKLFGPEVTRRLVLTHMYGVKA